jgi:hypothetical protein
MSNASHGDSDCAADDSHWVEALGTFSDVFETLLGAEYVLFVEVAAGSKMRMLECMLDTME